METKQNKMDDYRLYEKRFSCFIKEKIIESGLINKDLININQSTSYEDSNLSFDMILSIDLQISVRLRKYKYRIYNDITIRSQSMKHGLTEIDKLKNGCGNIYFYGYMDTTEMKIIKWLLFKIDPIRNLLDNCGNEYTNIDGTKLKTYSFGFLRKNKSLISYGNNEKTIINHG